MDFVENLKPDTWSKADPNTAEDFEWFRLARNLGLNEKEGSFEYGVFDTEGMLKKVVLVGVCDKHDPLKGVGRLQLKLSSDGTHIIGICIEDECMMNTSLARS